MNAAVPEQAVLRISNLRGFLTVLQAIKPSSSKQVCTVILCTEGLWVKWDDESKSLQSSLFLGQQLFAEYHCPWVRKQFGLPFGVFHDTITVFLSSLSQSAMVIKFPGANEELVCEMMEESNDSSTICTYSHLDTREPRPSRDLSDYWEEPSSYFLVSGSILKEAIEDLEWAAGNGSMLLNMQRHPPSISMSASSHGHLKIILPADDLQGFQCAEGTIEHRYKYKHLRAIVANLPQPKDPTAQTTSKVTIDSQGLIKVTHMMSLQGPPRVFGGTYQGVDAFAESQRANNGNVGVVRFVSAPEDIYAE